MGSDFDKIKKQINTVNMFSEMVKDATTDYIEYKSKYKEWETDNSNDWRNRPYSDTTKAQIKRLMLMQRQETIKLDKMLNSSYWY